jgi:hypothetical protein
LLARRYRPAAQVMVFAGLIAQIPWFIPEARLPGTVLTYRELALLGLLLLLIGTALWVASIYRVHRAYVRCLPDYLLIRTAASKTAIAYPRINAIKSVKVGDLFRRDEVKGSMWQFIKPLAGDTALEVIVNEYPIPEKQLRRRLSQFMFTPREAGFVFIVERPTQLATEIDGFSEELRLSKNKERQRYLDPIERAKYSESSRTGRSDPFTRE